MSPATAAVQINLELSIPQLRVFNDRSRFRVVVAGRRGGKTRLAATEIIAELLKGPDRNVAYVAPTYSQAKRLMWRLLLRLIPRELIAEKNVSELTLTLKNGSVVTLFGAQNYDTIRGSGYDLIVFDEAADIPEAAWTEAARPALSDRKGRALFIGTPKGIGNWLYDLWVSSVTLPGWSRFSYTTIEGGWVEQDEIDAARAQLDERTFRQEYEASFEQYGGLVYHTYDDTASIAAMPFRADAETWMCWDFNAGERPMSVILVQRIDGVYYANREFVYTNTSTEEMCQTIKRYFDEQSFSGTLHVTGDHYGNRRESSASRSDYLIIESWFKNYRGYERKARPTTAIQDRVNAINSLFRAASGIQRLYIDPSCKALRKGLTRVTWKENGSGLQEVTIGDLDPTDALSYFAYNYHPVHRRESTTMHR